jgi:hypothetical protein
VSERGSSDRAAAAGQEFLPSVASGVEDPRRRAWLAAAALTLGLSATAACAPDIAGPVAPSPGLLVTSPTAVVSKPPASTPAPSKTPKPSKTVASTPPTTQTPVTPSPSQTKPGIVLIVAPRSDGSLDITEDVTLSAATNMLQLQVPRSGEHLLGMMTRTEPRATNLQVLADGLIVPLEDSDLTGTRDVPLITAATNVQLTYRLSGSTVRRTPSKPERANAAISPLTASADGSIPTNITVEGGRLLNAVCPLLVETRCTVPDPPKLRIRPNIPADKALVVLQLDLPQPQ